MVQQLKPLPAFVVFLSGYLPLALLVAVLDWNWEDLSFNSPWTVGSVGAAFALSCIFTGLHFRHYAKGERLKVRSVQDRSVELLNYAIPYIAGFAGIDTGNFGHIGAMFLVLWVVFYVTYKTHTVVVNPFLLSLGYRLYDLEFEWPDGKVSTTMAVSKLPLTVGTTVRGRNISTSCIIVIALVPDE
ncbi:MAG: hypothetical protein PHQ04_05640 [Opitutaceae bacterium]|nr:hypothetical protein [Opitutaceae bacterium]